MACGDASRRSVPDIVVTLVKAGVRPRESSWLVRQVARELNAHVDASPVSGEAIFTTKPSEHYRMHFDGNNVSGRGVGGSGWLLEGATLPRVGGRFKESDLQRRCAAQATQTSTARVSVEFHALSSWRGLSFLSWAPEWHAALSVRPCHGATQ